MTLETLRTQVRRRLNDPLGSRYTDDAEIDDALTSEARIIASYPGIPNSLLSSLVVSTNPITVANDGRVEFDLDSALRVVGGVVAGLPVSVVKGPDHIHNRHESIEAPDPGNPWYIVYPAIGDAASSLYTSAIFSGQAAVVTYIKASPDPTKVSASLVDAMVCGAASAMAYDDENPQLAQTLAFRRERLFNAALGITVEQTKAK